MKNFLLVLLGILLMPTIYSQSRDAEQALQVASSFLLTRSLAAPQRMPLDASALQAVVLPGDTADCQAYYIFNIGEEGGFVIVSGDERARDILAYSDYQHVDPYRIPDNMRYWLSTYSTEITLLGSMLDVPLHESKAVDADAVAPLLGSIKWNQGDPYNLLCPIIDSNNGTRAVVGCVATAMAQLMKYYRWPERGIGSNTYTTKTLKIPLSEDFSSTSYDWDKMTSSYNTSSTQEERRAIAMLMYHAGVAVNMDYNTSSGAFVSDMGRGLINHFGYDQHLQVKSRDFYERDAWQQLLLNELYASRPVLYAGASAEGGGHLWVCDGVDRNGYFHFNWGWGGMSDGYFAITALNPASLGIGGGIGGYNSYQQITTGVIPPDPSSRIQLAVYMNDAPEASVSGLRRAQKFNVTVKRIFNYGIQTVNMQLGLGLFNGNTLVSTLASNQVDGLQANYGWNTYTFNNLGIPTTVPIGNYQVRLMHRSSEQYDWEAVPVRVGVPSYLDARLSKDSIYLLMPEGQVPLLELEDLQVVGGIYQDKTGRFSVQLKNSGAEYNSSVMIRLSPVVAGSTIESSREMVNLIRDESRTVLLSTPVTVSPGEYWLQVMVDVANNYSSPLFQALGEKVQVSVLPTPVTPATLTLSESISFPDNSSVSRSQATLTATITNQGGVFENYMVAFIFPLSGGSSLGYIGYQQVIIDSLETATIRFQGDISMEEGEYQIGAYYYDAGWKRINPMEMSMLGFTLVDDSVTSLFSTDKNEIALFPNPATDEVFLVTSQTVDRVAVYSLDGRCLLEQTVDQLSPQRIFIADLHPGVYLLRAYRDGDSPLVFRFIKK